MMNYASRYIHDKQHRHKITNGLLFPSRTKLPMIGSLFSSMLFIPTSIILLALVVLLAYNSFNIFYVRIPSPLTMVNSSSTPSSSSSSSSLSLSSVEPSIVFPKNAQESVRKLYSSSSTNSPSTRNVISLGHSAGVSSIQLTMSPNDRQSSYTRKKRRKHRKKHANKFSYSSLKSPSKGFSQRVSEFFSSSSSKPCKPRFFMTWISSLESFSTREALTIESLFRSHSNGCLLIVSTSMDSDKGIETLKPFLDRNLKILAIAPDVNFLFKNTAGAAWFDQLKKGRVKPGEVSLAQNLSNLLRLALLYKYGGIYMDTDFIILRPLSGLKNVIGAQNYDPKSGNWTRLNNALMIFDKRHPLVGQFIEEFALTFNGNKWGYNGPYLVSRVVKRVSTEGPELNFTVLPPSAFYPVDWGRIWRLFRRWEEGEEERWWMQKREERIRKESYGVHLWNRQSKSLKVENGSVIAHLMLDSCLFCNSTSLEFQI